MPFGEIGVNWQQEPFGVLFVVASQVWSVQLAPAFWDKRTPRAFDLPSPRWIGAAITKRATQIDDVRMTRRRDYNIVIPALTGAVIDYLITAK